MFSPHCKGVYTCTQTHTHTRTHARTHTHTHACTHARTHTTQSIRTLTRNWTPEKTTTIEVHTHSSEHCSSGRERWRERWGEIDQVGRESRDTREDVRADNCPICTPGRLSHSVYTARGRGTQPCMDIYQYKSVGDTEDKHGIAFSTVIHW